jgi:hypothetical protein
MARLSIFLTEYTSAGGLKPQTGVTSAFLQPQPDASSFNPSSKTADADSILLVQSSVNPGQYYADISNPVPRYDLYINNEKQADFSGTAGFEIPSSKSIYIKKNVQLNSDAATVGELFTTGSGKLANPDGGQTWPKFSTDLDTLPHIIITSPSESEDPTFYPYREVKILRGSTSVYLGNLSFTLILDANGPELNAYFCDIMIILL